MPLKYMSDVLHLSKGVNIDYRDDEYFYSDRLHNIPVNRMVKLSSVTVNISGLDIEYDLERVIGADFEY